MEGKKCFCHPGLITALIPALLDKSSWATRNSTANY